RLFVNDVGQSAREEIDDVRPGMDYGWNCREGNAANPSAGTSCSPLPPGLTNPIYDYDRSGSPVCRSITGGAFVPNQLWPVDWRGDYLFADFVCGKIFRLDAPPGGGVAASDFVT